MGDLQAAEHNEGKFIFGLWGSPDHRWWRGRVAPNRDEEKRLAKRWQTKTVPEVRRAARLIKSLGAVTYAVGQDAAAVLRQAGHSPVVLSADEKQPHWTNKLRFIEHALSDYRQVVFLDWDAKRLRPVPHDFWESLADRAPLQARIRQYKRRKCFWRPEHKRTLCSAAFVYAREQHLIRQAIDWLANQPEPGLTEEHAIAWVLDQAEGGWRGLDAYHAKYDTPWYTIPGEIFPCENPVFTAS